MTINIELLCSHYKDSYDIHRETIKKRDILFYILLILMAFFLIYTKQPLALSKSLDLYINKQTGITITKDIISFSTVFWILISVISLKYFQIVIEIERQYKYIHKIESTLQNHFLDGSSFTREGASYKNSNKYFNKWSKFIYGYFFTVMLMASITINIVLYIINLKSFHILTLINISCFITTFISSALYLITISRKKI